MKTQLQAKQADDIREAASLLLESFSRKNFEKKIAEIDWNTIPSNADDWKSSPVNRFCRTVIQAGGYDKLDVSTYAGITVIGIHNTKTEFFQTHTLPGHDARHECRVDGWEQYQQVVNPDWAYYIGLYTGFYTGNNPISESDLLSVLKVFDINPPNYAGLTTYSDSAREWCLLQNPLSLFIE